jgi:hypothetical protein
MERKRRRADFRMEVGPRRHPPKRVCNTEAREAFERLRQPRHARRRQSIDKALPAGVPRVAQNSALSATARFARMLRNDSSRFRLSWVQLERNFAADAAQESVNPMLYRLLSKEVRSSCARRFYLSLRLQWWQLACGCFIPNRSLQISSLAPRIDNFGLLSG